MTRAAVLTSPWRLAIYGTLLATLATGVGCQVDVGGMTLPSGYFLKDDVQYFPSGSEIKLSREAAAQKAYREEQMQQAR